MDERFRISEMVMDAALSLNFSFTAQEVMDYLKARVDKSPTRRKMLVTKAIRRGVRDEIYLDSGNYYHLALPPFDVMDIAYRDDANAEDDKRDERERSNVSVLITKAAKTSQSKARKKKNPKQMERRKTASWKKKVTKRKTKSLKSRKRIPARQANRGRSKKRRKSDSSISSVPPDRERDSSQGTKISRNNEDNKTSRRKSKDRCKSKKSSRSSVEISSSRESFNSRRGRSKSKRNMSDRPGSNRKTPSRDQSNSRPCSKSSLTSKTRRLSNDKSVKSNQGESWKFLFE